MNNICYTFQELPINDKNNILFNDTIDATYVLHLSGNGRLPDVLSQLNNIRPTEKLYILHNKGFKNCEKNLYKQLPRYDLIDSIKTIFEHSQYNNYNNILILEDDFIFNEQIKDKNNICNITCFVNKNKNNQLLYSLGSLPFLMIPIEPTFTTFNSLSAGMHCCIYNKNYIQTLLCKMNNGLIIDDWDVYNACKYNYYKPLCFQIFPNTDNRKSWPSYFFISHLFSYLIRLLNLDNDYYPGYYIMYFIAYLNMVLILLFFYKIIKNI
jgi:hypothetical protein